MHTLNQLTCIVSGDKNPDKSQGELGGLLKKMGYSEADVYKFWILPQFFSFSIGSLNN